MIRQNAQFKSVALPLVTAPAFLRLRSITFMGIISPKYRCLPRFPIDFGVEGVPYDGGTRASHSLSVARSAYFLARRLNLSEIAQRYAIAWGLVHDIATWPLSHTGEAAFSHATNIESRALRKMMILGSNRLPANLSLYSPIVEAGVEVEVLAALFEKNASGFEGDIAILHKLIHSPLTPDTLEGMHRSGRVFGVCVPGPDKFNAVLSPDLFSGILIEKEYSGIVFKFWRAKSRIYNDFINSRRSIRYESLWSRAIRDKFCRVSLVGSLEMSEEEIIRKIYAINLIRDDEIYRYKSPLSYEISCGYKGRRVFFGPVSLEDLGSVLIKRQREF